MKKNGFLVLHISIFILFFTFFSLSNPHVSHAQSSIGNVSLDGVDIEMSPANPAPGDSVTVDVKSYSTDLNGATINWSSNGKSIGKSVGLTSITVQAPPVGKSLAISVSVKTVEGATIQKVLTIKTGSVDIIPETSGYVPPLYRGKNLFVYQNTVKLVAMPNLVDSNGKPIDPQALIYTWKQDSTVLGSLSGYGKQSLSIKGSLIARPFVINLKVNSTDGKAHAESQIAINPSSPAINFYQNDPLYGVLYNKSVGDSINLEHNQIKITAAPYGFDMADDSGTMTYSWMINEILHDELASSSAILLATPSGTSGSSDIKLEIQNTTDILQRANNSFSAIYDTTSNKVNGAASITF